MRHLKAFHIFHIAAESASYSQAADKLHITHGAVSKQIKTLEEHLSQALFYKHGRHMRLTPAGELLKQHTSIAFDALRVGIHKIQKNSKPYLEVSCEPTLTMRWLMPRLADFYLSSGIDIRFSTAGGPINLEERGLSMAIRRDDFKIPDEYHQIKLVEEWIGPVCSPEYWSQINKDHDKVTLIHSKTRPNAWLDWMSQNQTLINQDNPSQTYDHFYFCIQAAIDGLGAVIGSYPLIEDDLKNGRLVAPFGFQKSGHHYSILCTDNEMNEQELKFRKWLQQTLSTSTP